MTDEQPDGALLVLYDDTVTVLIERGWDNTELREAYSGRNMFGASCPAIVTDAPPAAFGAAFAVACMRQELDVYDEHTTPADMVQRTELLVAAHLPKRIDNMGKNQLIFY